MGVPLSVDSGDPQEVGSLFDRTARTYDALNHLLSFNVDRLWRLRLLKASAAGPGARVLDVCTGTGDVALGFARRFRDAHVNAVDLAPAMIELAREKALRRGFSTKVAFRVADALALPFGSESFDVVCNSFGVRTLTDYRRGIEEMARVARPGGRVLVLEFEPPPATLFGRLYGWYLRSAMPALGVALSGNRASYSYLSDSIERFPLPDQMVGLMDTCGLESCSYEPLSGGIACLFVGVRA